MVTEAMDINTDPGYYRATDPGVALSSRSGLDVIRALVEAQATQLSMALSLHLLMEK